jgi:hypothetical protein
MLEHRNADVACTPAFLSAFMQHISPKNSVVVSQQFGLKTEKSDNIL